MENVGRSLLIYIPCHSDFDLAIIQAKQIQREFRRYKKNINSFIQKIEIIISVNYFEPSKPQLELANTVADLVILNTKLLLADANIANGFMVAYQRGADFFWILSANDELLDLGFSKMANALNIEVDLLVTCIPEANQMSIINNVINPSIKGYSFGLISGVIYNCRTLKLFFNTSQFFIWTGWSQLSVIQNAINQKGFLKIKSINTFEIYKQKQTEPRELAHKYGHSFYGYILLGYIFAKTKNEKKKFIITYIIRNTFRISLYRRKVPASNKIINSENYLYWNQDLAEAAIKHSSIILYFYYYLFCRLPFFRLTREFNHSKKKLL